MEKESSESPEPHNMLAESLMNHLGISKNHSFNGISTKCEKQGVGNHLRRLLDVVSDGALVPLMHFTLSRSHVEKISELKGLGTFSLGEKDDQNNLGSHLKLDGFNPEHEDKETDVDEALAAADNDIPKWILEQEGRSNCGIISDEDDSLSHETREPPKKVVKEAVAVEDRNVRYTMKAHLYKHVVEDVAVLVNPDTYEVIGDISMRLRELLGTTSMKELVGWGVFTFDVAVDIIANSGIIEDQVDKKAKRREDCANAAERRQLDQLSRGRVSKF